MLIYSFLCPPVVFKGLNLVTLNIFFVFSNKQNALPLIHRLKYAQEYDKAMQYVFGRTLLCRDINFALDIAEKGNFDCITLGGDQVSILKSIICIK